MSQKSPWESGGPSKILRIVTAVLGKRFLQGWRETRADFGVMYPLARPMVYNVVKDFSSQKLGEVCSYATRYGYHDDKWKDNDVPAFINWHGYGKLTTLEVKAIFEHYEYLEVMRWVAVATIIAIAVDYAWQDKMKICWYNPEQGGWKLDSRRE